MTMESIIDSLINSVMKSTFMMFVIVQAVVLLFFYLVAFLPFYLQHQSNNMDVLKRKIHKSFTSPEIIKKEIRLAAWDAQMVAVNVLIFILVHWKSLTTMTLPKSMSVDFKGVMKESFKSIVALVLVDLWQFGFHHLSHKIKSLWNEHKVHHQFFNPNPFTLFANKPSDIFVLSMALPLCSRIFHMNVWTTIALFLINVINGIMIHSGFRYRHLSNNNPIFMTSTHHYIHHTTSMINKNINCGFMFKWWDQLCNSLQNNHVGEDEGDGQPDASSIESRVKTRQVVVWMVQTWFQTQFVWLGILLALYSVKALKIMMTSTSHIVTVIAITISIVMSVLLTKLNAKIKDANPSDTTVKSVLLNLLLVLIAKLQSILASTLITVLLASVRIMRTNVRIMITKARVMRINVNIMKVSSMSTNTIYTRKQNLPSTNCMNVFKKGSKTFYLASRLFPKKIRNDIAELYSFCRCTDDMIDESTGVTQRFYLDLIKQHLQDIDNDDSIIQSLKRVSNSIDLPIDTATILNAFFHNANICNKFSIPRKHYSLILRGYRWDVDRKPIQTDRDLIEYSMYVAGYVGVMASYIFGIAHNPDTLVCASSLGIAFQLTNIARDIITDSNLHRVYIPESWFYANGLHTDANDPFNKLKQGHNSPQHVDNAYIHMMAKRMVYMAESFYKYTFDNLDCLPIHLRPSITVALMTYREIGVKILASDHYNKRETTSVAEKIMTVSKIPMIKFDIRYPIDVKRYINALRLL